MIKRSSTASDVRSSACKRAKSSAEPRPSATDQIAASSSGESIIRFRRVSSSATPAPGARPAGRKPNTVPPAQQDPREPTRRSRAADASSTRRSIQTMYSYVALMSPHRRTDPHPGPSPAAPESFGVEVRCVGDHRDQLLVSRMCRRGGDRSGSTSRLRPRRSRTLCLRRRCRRWAPWTARPMASTSASARPAAGIDGGTTGRERPRER
jgi:hypothetical protein